MTINKHTPIHKILVCYPHLIEKLAAKNHAFEFLKTPAYPTQTAYTHTVAQIAAIAGENENDLLSFLRQEIEDFEIQFRS